MDLENFATPDYWGELWRERHYRMAARRKWAPRKLPDGFTDIVQRTADKHSFDECVKLADEAQKRLDILAAK